MLRLSFGAEPEARAAAARINAIHDRVNGRLPDDAGVFPAGTVYSAHDPALLAWVHATLLDTNLRVYALLVGDLPLEDKDRYCAEASLMEAHLGIPEGRLPRSEGELREYMDAMLASGEISVTDTARTLARAIVHPAAPRVVSPAMWLMRQIIIGLLPPAIRTGYRFRLDRAERSQVPAHGGSGPRPAAADAIRPAPLAGRSRGPRASGSTRWVSVFRLHRVAGELALTHLSTPGLTCTGT